MEKLKITILTDEKSWMNKYNLYLKSFLEEQGHTVFLINSKTDITQGNIVFFLSCFEIISQKYLELNKYNIVVHSSQLPRGKGWSPTTWQILEGKNIIPITLFEASEKVDAGDIYIQENFCLDGTELIEEWQDKLARKIIELCLKFVKNYKNLPPIKQVGEESFYKKRTPKDSELDINKSIKEQFNLLRVVDNENYPAFFVMNNKKYILKVLKDE